MFDSIPSRIAVGILIVAVGAILVTLAIAYLGGSAESGSNNKEYRRIIIYTPIYNTGERIAYNLTYARIQDIPTNSDTRFLSPFGKTMSSSSFPEISADNNLNDIMTENERTALVTGADAFEQYVLIRLPPELGGDADSIDAFRAYSILDPGSKCIMGYWPNSYGNGAVLVDPCQSDIFRVSDGYSCYGKIVSGNPILSAYNAIPTTRLSVDDEGYLLAARPDGQPSGDGTVGEGRIMAADEIEAFEGDPSCDFILNNNR
jgi:hypothetical protein